MKRKHQKPSLKVLKNLEFGLRILKDISPIIWYYLHFQGSVDNEYIEAIKQLLDLALRILSSSIAQTIKRLEKGEKIE